MGILLQIALWTLAAFGAVLALPIMPGWYWWALAAVLASALIVDALAARGLPWAIRLADWLVRPHR